MSECLYIWAIIFSWVFQKIYETSSEVYVILAEEFFVFLVKMCAELQSPSNAFNVDIYPFQANSLVAPQTPPICT